MATTIYLFHLLIPFVFLTVLCFISFRHLGRPLQRCHWKSCRVPTLSDPTNPCFFHIPNMGRIFKLILPNNVGRTCPTTWGASSSSVPFSLTNMGRNLCAIAHLSLANLGRNLCAIAHLCIPLFLWCHSSNMSMTTKEDSLASLIIDGAC